MDLRPEAAANDQGRADLRGAIENANPKMNAIPPTAKTRSCQPGFEIAFSMKVLVGAERGISLNAASNCHVPG